MDSNLGHAVDDWGRDPSLVRAVMRFSQIRWDVAIGGQQHLPRREGALVVINARALALAPIFSALALSKVIDRPVRFVGRPDTAPIGAFLRRIGGLLDDPDEVAGALAAKEIVIVGASHDLHLRKVGRVDHALVGAALAAGAAGPPGPVRDPCRGRGPVGAAADPWVGGSRF